MYPTLDYSTYAIVVYKKYDEWVASMKRYGAKDYATREVYDNYLNAAMLLNQDNVIIARHDHIDKNYGEFIDAVSEKFGMDIFSKLKPEYRLSRGGAKTRFTGEPWKPNYK